MADLLVFGVLQVYYGVYDTIFVFGVALFCVCDHISRGKGSLSLPLLWCINCGAGMYPIWLLEYFYENAMKLGQAVLELIDGII